MSSIQLSSINSTNGQLTISAPTVKPLQPIAQAYSNQAVSTAANANIYMNTTNLNVGGMYNTTTGGFTITIPGTYELNVRLSINTAAAGKFYLALNGTNDNTINNIVFVGTSSTEYVGTYYYNFKAGDTFTVNTANAIQFIAGTQNRYSCRLL